RIWVWPRRWCTRPCTSTATQEPLPSPSPWTPRTARVTCRPVTRSCSPDSEVEWPLGSHSCVGELCEMVRLGRSWSWVRCGVPVHVLAAWGACLAVAECLFGEPGRPGCPTGAAAAYGRRGKDGPQEWPKLPHLERGRQALSE